jgi:hypothetical protein
VSLEHTVKKVIRNVNGVSVNGYEKEFVSACIMKAEVGTTGDKGGDTGHGGRSYIHFQDLGSTDMKVVPYKTPYDCSGVIIEFGGDCELDCLIDSLQFMLEKLYKQGRNKDIAIVEIIKCQQEE